jgi:hypothetical protein
MDSTEDLRRAYEAADILSQHCHLDHPIWIVERFRYERKVFTSIPLSEWEDSMYEDRTGDEIIVKPLNGVRTFSCAEAWKIAIQLHR